MYFESWGEKGFRMRLIARKSMSLKSILYEKLQNKYRTDDPWMWGGQLEDYARAVGYKASNASRRLRELYESGLIERREMEVPGKHIRAVQYRWKDRDKEEGKIKIEIPITKATEETQKAVIGAVAKLF